MASDKQSPSKQKPTEERLARLIERASMINLIHEALLSTLEVDQLYPIVLGTLVSRQGMGFSRAILLAGDSRGEFRFHSGLGALDAETDARVRAEIVEQQEQHERTGGQERGEERGGEASIFSHDIGALKSRGFWSAAADKFETIHPLDEKLQDLAIGAHGQDHDESRRQGEFIERLFSAGAAVVVSPEETENLEAPSEFKTLFSTGSLWAGIRTKRGNRLILVVDKAFEPEPIDEVDRLHMDWFCCQIGLALENAELVSELVLTNESLQDLDTLKSNFLSTISHELRTPLTAISGFTRLLISHKVGEVTPGQKQILDRVLEHSDRLSNVVNDLIEIAEIDAGAAVPVHVHPVDPLQVLMETLPKLDPRRSSKTVAVEPVVAGPVPRIQTDEKALGRIFYHLLDNAIKFSGENGKVSIKFEPSEGELAIQIVDEGIGIPPERLRQIFESFYQVDSNLTRAHAGMGIGLTLTKKLLDETGGRIVVQSDLGSGSRFTIIYPRA